MSRNLIILTYLFLFFGAGSVFAISPPIQISPTDSFQVSSSKLTWETPSYQLYSNNPYRIQVDDNPDFSSIYRDYNTKNTYYSPVLTEGIWYWRIKSKDSGGNWSDWSNSWSFNLTTATSSSSPTQTPSPTPSSTPTPTPIPTPTPTPSSSALKTKTTSAKSSTPAPAAIQVTPLPSTNDTEIASLPVKSLAKIEYKVASVAAATTSATSSAKTEVKNQKQINPLLVIGIIFIFAGVGSIGYIYLKKRRQ